MTILCLSTSTGRGSVALLKAAEAVAVSYVDLQGHAERLFGAIDEVLAKAGETRSTLTGVACDVGPGSFTGVRVGVASAKGIALGLGLPLAGVTSLEAMARAAFALGLASRDDLTLAAIDAKKDEVFLALHDEHGRAIVEPRACAVDGFARLIESLRVSHGQGLQIVLVGEVLAAIPLPNGLGLARHADVDLPDAAWIGRCAVRGDRLDHEGDVEPLYVRPPDALLPGEVRKGPAVPRAGG